jgi:hypothetical protein
MGVISIVPWKEQLKGGYTHVRKGPDEDYGNRFMERVQR